jgi:hypothetical protein
MTDDYKCLSSSVMFTQNRTFSHKMLSIKLTEVADLKCQDIPGHKTSLTSPLFIEVPVSSQESWCSYI